MADRYATEQTEALALSRVPHPHTGHVPLRGFYEPTRRDELTALVRTRASEQQPIEIIGEAVVAFPEPWHTPLERTVDASFVHEGRIARSTRCS